MTAPLLYNMFKSKTNYPLHSAIRLQREDVVFLYLIEFSSSVRYFHLIVFTSALFLIFDFYFFTT